MTDLPHPPSRLSRFALTVFGASLLGMAALAGLSGSRLPAETLPMQWGVDGAAVLFGPRVVSLWGLVVVLAIVGAAIVAKAQWAQPTEGSTVSRALIVSAAIAATAQLFHVWMLLQWGGV